ncbi:hypothetical protein ACQKM1_09405 [Peribacillus frigoritolerans]
MERCSSGFASKGGNRSGSQTRMTTEKEKRDANQELEVEHEGNW